MGRRVVRREGACIDFTFHRNKMEHTEPSEGVERQVGKGELHEGAGGVG